MTLQFYSVLSLLNVLSHTFVQHNKPLQAEIESSLKDYCLEDIGHKKWSPLECVDLGLKVETMPRLLTKKGRLRKGILLLV